MKSSSLYLLIVSIVMLWTGCSISNYGTHYITKWQEFYPSKAYNQGFQSSVYQTEDYSEAKVNAWIAFNESTIARLSSFKEAFGPFDSIDARLLINQAKSELEIWKNKKIHKNSLVHYTTILSTAFTDIIAAEMLTESEKVNIICSKFETLNALCTSAIQNLKSCEKKDVERGLAQLRETIRFLQSDLSIAFPIVEADFICKDYKMKSDALEKRINECIDFVNEKLLPNATDEDPMLGEESYGNALALYTDSAMTPDQLAEMAREEIDLVKGLILSRSKSYLLETYPDAPLPSLDDDIIARTFEDMEKDAPLSSADYLAFWTELAESATTFLKDKDLVTLPRHESLRILTAPESAGPAARIGWVDVAPAFAPNPLTTLYLPSIPDTLTQEEQVDFWSSFNKPFNRMIVIHELYPGHYMQFTIARESPHPVRLLFPYGPYAEGWATFCEMVALDAGWEAERPLTYIAHLRKRLENANRAYTSVMVHCKGWTEDQVIQFSVEESLLAPQFAKSLWGRLLRSPMQMTSYFYGGQQFKDLLAFEKERLGAQFELKEFMDTILKSGPIPVDAFYGIFAFSKN